MNVLNILQLSVGFLAVFFWLLGESIDQKPKIRENLKGVSFYFLICLFVVDVVFSILILTNKLVIVAELEWDKAKEPICYTYKNNKLCGDFVFEDKKFKIIGGKDHTLDIVPK